MLANSLDGQALESVFDKVKLNCSQMKDPAFRLALLLHNPLNANEVMLLSLRDCLGGLPDTDPFKRWYARKSNVKTSPALLAVLESLQTDLQTAWRASTLTEKQRFAIVRLLDVLEDQPPYLDLTILQIAGYQKLGNWSRAEELVRRWLSLTPLDRLEQTPARRDALARYMRENIDVFLEALAQGREDRVILEMFFAGLREYITDVKVTDAVKSIQNLDVEELLQKLSLRYHRTQAPAFVDWFLNRHLTEARHGRFVDRLLASPSAAERVWVFLGRLPETPLQREALGRLLLKDKREKGKLFYVLADDPTLSPILGRLEPGAMKNFIKERRQYFLSAYSEKGDILALAKLVEMGQISEDLIDELLAR